MISRDTTPFGGKAAAHSHDAIADVTRDTLLSFACPTTWASSAAARRLTPAAGSLTDRSLLLPGHTWNLVYRILPQALGCHKAAYLPLLRWAYPRSVVVPDANRSWQGYGAEGRDGTRARQKSRIARKCIKMPGDVYLFD